MSDDIEVFAFDKDEIKGGVLDKYKGAKNETHRLGVVYTNPKAMFAGSKVHFKERYFLCKKGKCCDVCGPSKWRVGAVVIKYGTDKQGNIKKPFSYELLPWLFSEATYMKLKNVNSEFPLASHDIKISCDNEEYQHLNITPCNESIWSDEKLKDKVLEEAKSIWDYVKKSIANNLSIEEINDLLGISTGASTDPSESVDLDAVLDDI